MTQRNEWTPRERGLMIGHTWAKNYEGDPFDLKPIADGAELPEGMRAAIEGLLVQSDDIENPTAFWGGFRHGVAAYLVEGGIHVRSEPPDDQT